MSASFPAGSALPPLFDSGRAARTMEELASLWSDVARQSDISRLLEAASGNSPFLARAMLKESAFLPEFFANGPEDVLARLNTEALAVAGFEDDASVMRALRIAKRRAALTIALADISGQFDVMILAA